MRRLAFMTLVALIAAAAAAAQQLPATPPTPRRASLVDPLTASIFGRVTRSDSGAPIRGAEVRLLIDGRSSRLATTDADGRYELRDLSAGSYRLAVSRTGFVPLQFGQRRPFEAAAAINLTEGARAEANVALIRGGVIYGRVLDQTGEPLIGTRVQALRSRSSGGQRRLQSVGAPDITDDIGSFRIYGLPPGDYYVAAAAGLGDQVKRDPPTYYPGTANFTEAQPIALGPGAEASAEFSRAAVRNARVSGIVVDSAGNPVQAMVNLVSEAITTGPVMGAGGGAGGPAPLQLHADGEPNGRFTIENVPPGPYVLTAMVFPREEPNPQTPGPRTAAQMARQLPQQAAMPLAVSGDDIGGLTIVTNRPSVLTGSVVADSGVTKPLPRNVRVTQRSVATAGTSMTMGNMNETDFQLVGMSGTFRIVVTVPDGWTLKAVMLDGRDVTDEPIDLRGQNATVRVVVSDRPSSVSGTALLRGAPADLDVVVFADDPTKWAYPSRFVRTVRADAQGRFQIADLPAGEYVAAALEYLEEGEQDDPQFLERLRSRGTSFSLIEGQQRAIQLDAIAR